MITHCPFCKMELTICKYTTLTELSCNYEECVSFVTSRYLLDYNLENGLTECRFIVDEYIVYIQYLINKVFIFPRKRFVNGKRVVNTRILCEINYIPNFDFQNINRLIAQIKTIITFS